MKKNLKDLMQLCVSLAPLALIIGAIVLCNADKFVWSAVFIAVAIILLIVNGYFDFRKLNYAEEIRNYKREAEEANKREAIFHKTIEDQRKENYSLSETIGALQAQLTSSQAYVTTLKMKLSRKPRPKNVLPVKPVSDDSNNS